MAKRKKVSRIVAPAVLIAVIALLIVGFIVLKNRESADDAETDSAEQAINIITSSADDIVSLTFKGSGDEITLVNSGGKWSMADDAEFPLNDTTVSSLLGEVATINAVRKIEGGDIADYGFDEPACTVTAVYADGVSHTYTAGSVNAHNSNQYLLCDDGRVYMISTDFATAFSKTKNDLLANETLPSVTAERTINVIIGNAAGETITLSDENAVVSGIDAFNALDFSTVGRIYAPGGDMSEYGITDTSPYITVNYCEAAETDADYTGEDAPAGDEAVFTLRFGNSYSDEDGEEYVYYSHPGSLIVYTIEKSAYEDAMELVHYTPETDAETVLS